ncbi:MAG TPA: 1,4-dihydroxy-6-naphthoate synthase [Egibacteraceae bacterium]|nr:1,4-dihydroxy-6-naphthoate synthase [Egibacteraceae bacterium]
MMAEPQLSAPLTLGYSPCPNDTFLFHAWVRGLISGPPVREVLDDVETLNQWARQTRLDLTKASYHAYGHLRGDYVALRAGGALGRGVGPLVVAREAIRGDLAGLRIAIPGELTTANLLLRLSQPGELSTVALRYEEIMRAVVRGDVDAGVIIHESRFTYSRHDLVEVLDLGRWWEADTSLPLPLGAILIRRSLGRDVAMAVNDALRRSLERAWEDPPAAHDYIRTNAIETDDAVIRAHIALYVNELSLDVGAEGEAAVRELLSRAERRGLIPPSDAPLRWP